MIEIQTEDEMTYESLIWEEHEIQKAMQRTDPATSEYADLVDEMAMIRFEMDKYAEDA